MQRCTVQLLFSYIDCAVHCEINSAPLHCTVHGAVHCDMIECTNALWSGECSKRVQSAGEHMEGWTLDLLGEDIDTAFSPGFTFSQT